MLQHHVGEAAGRRADVRADLSAHIDPERVDRMGELHPAAPHPWMLQFRDAKLVLFRNRRAGLVDELPVDENAPGHDQRLRLRARVHEPALDERHVEALLLHGASARTVKPSWWK